MKKIVYFKGSRLALLLRYQNIRRMLVSSILVSLNVTITVFRNFLKSAKARLIGHSFIQIVKNRYHKKKKERKKENFLNGWSKIFFLAFRVKMKSLSSDWGHDPLFAISNLCEG